MNRDRRSEAGSVRHKIKCGRLQAAGSVHPGMKPHAARSARRERRRVAVVAVAIAARMVVAAAMVEEATTAGKEFLA
jgi:hypothetical protein